MFYFISMASGLPKSPWGTLVDAFQQMFPQTPSPMLPQIVKMVSLQHATHKSPLGTFVQYFQQMFPNIIQKPLTNAEIVVKIRLKSRTN